jgi:hypothetical protein
VNLGARRMNGTTIMTIEDYDDDEGDDRNEHPVPVYMT